MPRSKCSSCSGDGVLRRGSGETEAFSAEPVSRYTPRMAASSVARLARGLLAALLFAPLAVGSSACGSRSSATKKDVTKDEPDGDNDPSLSEPPARPPVRPKADDPDDPNKLVYLVSNQNSLYSFSPKIPGKAAYRLVGKLDCKAFGTPQSMAVDRNGFAWVFYDSGQLFKVSIIDASCQSTNYKHPTPNGLLGMGFTAVASGSAAERLYIISPDFGLANITMPDLSVVKLRTMHTTSELTGGGDGKLFQFESLVRRLSEFDTSTFSSHPIHTFSTMSNISAFAFARYAGKFYMFTSRELEWSQTTEYDPKTNTESVRDAAIGFVVVGAGQSTLVPKGDGGGGDLITGTFND